MKSELFNQYASAIAELSGIDKSDIFLKTKRREVSDCRHLLYYMCKKSMINISYIRKYMKDNGYETESYPVSYGIKSVKNKVDKDPHYSSIVSKIESQVNF